MSKLFCIADIHGRYDLLKQLWDDLVLNHALDLTSDKVVFTGDYVDRGPDSYSVIAFLKDLQEKHPDNVICLAGNHEYINIMNYARKSPDDVWLHDNNGGPATLRSYQAVGHNGMTQEHLQWLVHLPLSHTEPGFHFSHAPVPRESYRNILLRGTDITPDEYMWTYHPDEPGVAKDFGTGVVQVVGHVHALRKGILAPRFYSHVIYADAGCGCSPKAPLCAIEVNTRAVIYAWP